MKIEIGKKIIYITSNKDWTLDPITRRPSEKYEAAVADVDVMLRSCKNFFKVGGSEDVAKSIVSYLAHKHGLAPIKERKKIKKQNDSEEMGLGGTSLRG